MPGVFSHSRRVVAPLGWPSVLVILIGAGLWLLWPRGSYAPFSARRLPEAGAAYLQLDSAQVPLYDKPDLFARPSQIGFGQVLPDAIRAHAPESTPPNPALFLEQREWAAGSATVSVATRTAEFRPMPAWDAGRKAVGSRTEGDPTSAWHIVLSPRLRQAGFSVLPPEVAPDVMLGRLRLTIETLDEDAGRHVFAQSEGMPEPAVRAWIRATHQATATGTVTRGFVDIFPATRFKSPAP